MDFELTFKTPSRRNFFFGYYDKSPVDSTSSKLLAQETLFIDREPREGDKIKVGFFEFKDSNSFHEVAETSAWNWQMGSMLQWMGPNFNNQIIFNDLKNDKFISRLISINSGEEVQFDMPIYAISPDGTYALCVDYERLFWHRRGYNYQGVKNHKKKILFDPDDAIWKLNFKTGEINKILSFKEISELSFKPSMRKGANYLEHIMINPSGREFIFYHRWVLDDGSIHTRALISDLDGENLRIINDTGRMSHVYWKNDETLIGFGSMPSPLLNLRTRYSFLRKYFFKPLLPVYHKISNGKQSLRNSFTGDGYYLFDSESSEKFEKIVHDSLVDNGHPSFHPKHKDIFVTDTYPETDNHQSKLMLFDIKNNKSSMIDKLKSIKDLDETPMRCDLHPKWSIMGDYISVDTQNDGHRSIYLYKHKERII